MSASAVGVHELAPTNPANPETELVPVGGLLGSALRAFAAETEDTVTALRLGLLAVRFEAPTQ